MSYPKPRKPRPLGSLRHISKTQSEKLPSIPKLLPDINSDVEKLKEGIHGNAMTVPPPLESDRSSSRRPSEDRPKSDKSPNKPPKSSASSGSAVSHENCEKEIKDGLNREKDLKSQISALKKQIEELQTALKAKEDETKTLKDQIETQEKDFTQRLNEETVSHDATKATLKEKTDDLDQAHERLGKMAEEHREELERQRLELENRLSETVAEKDAVIADRDQKLSRLKSQMADALKGNSWERQQQLEELTKELSRIQEESDMLRMKIKAMSKSKQGQCANCAESLSKVSKLQTTVKEKDESIKELKTLCAKFESQLSKQDKLLEQWALSKGQHITAPK